MKFSASLQIPNELEGICRRQDTRSTRLFSDDKEFVMFNNFYESWFLITLGIFIGRWLESRFPMFNSRHKK
jgi:hypothetical protein